MANLPETSTFDPNVNELLTTDLVLGGPSGPANAAAQNLTNRTRWLYDQNTSTQAALVAIAGEISTLNGQVSTINGQITSINANLASINGQLPLLAPLANPSFSGAPTAPTPGSLVNNAQIATTAYVFNWFAPKGSPSFTGTPTAPTQALGDSSSALATTAFVNPGSLVAANGYRKNPDGTIEQWGSVSKAAGTQGTTVTFPTSFLTSSYNVQLTSTSTTGPSATPWSQFVSPGPGTSGFTINANDYGGGGPNPTVTVYWRAVGK